MHTTISGNHGTRYAVSAAGWVIAALWMVAGVAAVMALGGGLTRVAVVVAIVITEWWLVSELEDRVEGRAGTRKS
jgi:hypothetical protein